MNLQLESRIAGEDRILDFQTGDGLVSPGSFREPELEALESVYEGGRVLVLEPNYGVVPCALSMSGFDVQAVSRSARACRFTRENLERNGAEARARNSAWVEEGEFDHLIYCPAEYEPINLVKSRLAQASKHLSVNGEITLCGRKKTGIKRYARFLSKVGEVSTQERSGVIVVEAVPEETSGPPGIEHGFSTSPFSRELDFTTCEGLFSYGEMDCGTEALLNRVELSHIEGPVLDLCCGYGAIGAYAGQIADCELWLSDDNQIATRCAECTLDANDVAGDVVTADCVEGVVGQTFDRVLCNPPTHAGDGVLSELFAGLEDVLSAEGRATIVHHQGLDFSSYLREFDNTQVMRTGSEHVVIDVHP